MSSERVVLAVDIGGSHVKVLASDRDVSQERSAASGPGMTPAEMMEHIETLTGGWRFDVVSVGYPGPVRDGRPFREPAHLGPGWTEFDASAAFGKPTRVINDAAMQALGSFRGPRMLFLGLGTGLGTALVIEGRVIDMEIGHLPYREGRSFEGELCEAALEKNGKHDWRRSVEEVATVLAAAFLAEEVVLGGGNARHLHDLSAPLRLGDNHLAFTGGFRLWQGS